MKNFIYSPASAALSELMLKLFRLNNDLIVSGDRLVAEIGLTSARWKVLGTIVGAETPQPVAWIARDMGANRQNIQRIVNDLLAEELLQLQPNPHHKRAPLIVLTESGKRAYGAAMALQAPWVNQLASGLSVADIEVTDRVISTLIRKLNVI